MYGGLGFVGVEWGGRIGVLGLGGVICGGFELGGVGEFGGVEC